MPAPHGGGGFAQPGCTGRRSSSWGGAACPGEAPSRGWSRTDPADSRLQSDVASRERGLRSPPRGGRARPRGRPAEGGPRVRKAAPPAIPGAFLRQIVRATTADIPNGILFFAECLTIHVRVVEAALFLGRIVSTSWDRFLPGDSLKKAYTPFHIIPTPTPSFPLFHPLFPLLPPKPHLCHPQTTPATSTPLLHSPPPPPLPLLPTLSHSLIPPSFPPPTLSFFPTPSSPFPYPPPSLPSSQLSPHFSLPTQRLRFLLSLPHLSLPSSPTSPHNPASPYLPFPSHSSPNAPPSYPSSSPPAFPDHFAFRAFLPFPSPTPLAPFPLPVLTFIPPLSFHPSSSPRSRSLLFSSRAVPPTPARSNRLGRAGGP